MDDKVINLRANYVLGMVVNTQRFKVRIGHVYPIRRRIGHIYPLSKK